MADLPARVGTKLGPRLAQYITQSIIYTHTRLVHVRHKLAMMIFHAISDEISDEVDVTLGPFLQKLHDAVTPDHPAYPAIHFMHTASGQLKAIAGSGLQITGLLGSISTVMNNELADAVYGLVRTNPHLLPDPASLAQMSAAGLVSQQDAQSAIAAQGINSGWSANMLLLAKSWPSVADGLELVRRGIATTDDFAFWCAMNGVGPDIAGMYEKTVTGPVSAADAALAVLRGNITQQQAEAIALDNGLDTEAFNILVQNTGEPPGLQQLLEGFRRGFIDQATLERGILESRYRNEWIPLLEKLRYSPISVADAVNAANQNQLDKATAASIADQNGLEPGQFDILLNTAGEPLSRTEMEELYNRGIVTQAQVEQALRESRVKNKYVPLAFDLHSKVLPLFTVQTALRNGGMDMQHAISAIIENGYSQADATAIADASQKELLKPYRDRVVTSVQTLYEDNLISSAGAIAAIEGAGFTAEQAAYVIKSSDARRQAHMFTQAVTAIKTKYLSHHITEQQASGYLDQFQVPSEGRDALLNLWKIEAGAFTRELTPAQVVKAVDKSLITADDGLARLIALGYNQADAQLLLNGA